MSGQLEFQGLERGPILSTVQFMLLSYGAYLEKLVSGKGLGRRKPFNKEVQSEYEDLLLSILLCGDCEYAGPRHIIESFDYSFLTKNYIVSMLETNTSTKFQKTVINEYSNAFDGYRLFQNH